MSENKNVENQFKQEKKFYDINLRIEDKVVVAIVLSLLSILISVFLTVFYQPSWVKENIESNNRLCSKINNEKLVLIGSGTVHEYIKESNILDKYFKMVDSTCLISVEVASLTACKTLKDEAEKSSNWIVMSSIRANINDFLDANEMETFKKDKRIVEVFLEKDKLSVITSHSDCFKKFFKTNGKTNADELKELLTQSKNLGFDIYTTSEESGTLRLYRNLIGQDELKETKKFGLSTIYPEDKPYVILGSHLYKPKKFNYDNHDSYDVFDIDGNAIEKELFLYFSVDFDNTTTNSSSSKEIIKFLNCVRADFTLPRLQNELIVRDNALN